MTRPRNALTPEDGSVPAQLDDRNSPETGVGTGVAGQSVRADGERSAVARPPATDVSGDGDEPVAVGGHDRGTARSGGVRGLLTSIAQHRGRTLVGLVIAALLVGLVVAGVQIRAYRALDQARDSALTAGTQSALALSSYDSTTLDRDFGAVTARSTPAFRDSFTQSSAALKQVLTQYNARATSTVISAGVSSVTIQRAVVLVFLNQVATNTNQKAGPTTDQSRLEITLSRSGDRWLIDAVKLL